MQMPYPVIPEDISTVTVISGEGEDKLQEEEYLQNATVSIKERYEEASKKVDTGEEEEAEELLNRILQRDESFAPALSKLAVLRIRQGEKKEASHLLQKALDVDPEFPPALSNMGNLLMEKGEKEKAADLYKKAIEVNPDYGPAYNNLGVIKRKEGEYKESIKYLKKARKKGTLSFKSSEKPMYKDPGCILPVVMLLSLILLLLFIFA